MGMNLVSYSHKTLQIQFHTILRTTSTPILSFGKHTVPCIRHLRIPQEAVGVGETTVPIILLIFTTLVSKRQEMPVQKLQIACEFHFPHRLREVDEANLLGTLRNDCRYERNDSRYWRNDSKFTPHMT
jgi:hypothetical protein